MSSSKPLPSSGTESEIKRITNFKKFGLEPYTLEPKKTKVPVTYGRNSLNDLASCNDVAINGVNGRTGNTKPGAPMETSIEGVCCLEIPEIYKPRFSSSPSLNVCRSDLV